MNPLFFVVPFVFLINLPCGYWRDGLKKGSPLWFVAIHLPVPFIIAARIALDMHLSSIYFLCVVPAYFGGQRMGALLRRRRGKVLDTRH